MDTLFIRVSIKNRFFEALDTLKANKVIRGVGTFARAYNINMSNLRALRYKKNGTVNSEYLYYLVRDYGINAHWLVTGVGNMFRGDELGLLISRTASTSKARKTWKNDEKSTEKCEKHCPDKIISSL